MAKSNRTSLPTREALLAFIEESPDDVGRREIARAFKVRGGDRARLKQMIKALEDESLIARGRRRRLAASGRLPPVAVVEVTGLDADGDPLARPLSWPVDSEPPRIVMLPERRGRPALGTGDRVLARLTRVAPGSFEGRTIRRLPAGPERVLGIYQRVGGEGRIAPTDRRVKTDFTVAVADSGGARPGELVLAETFPGRRLGLPRARIVERLGASLDDPRSFSLIAIHANRIPTTFPPAALKEAAAARPVVTAPGAREDLRKLPLVTIDGADARDFDDAVWAEPDPDEGWHAVVAIADVGHYVRPGSALDRAAYERGNSVYFPDRVVPMLPEALSNDLCSLRPGETRPCLAVHLWIDRRGKLRRHRFVRALIRSAARLTYEQVEAAHGGRPDDAAGPLRESVIAPLFGVYRALIGARRRRGAIDLDLPERKVTLDADGHVAAVVPRPRLESHRLIEELMIAANVAAAETLAKQRAPVMYRVHDEPAAEKVVELRKFLAGLGHKLPAGQRPRPAHFNRLLREVEGRPQAPAINTAVLRAQAKAAYSPANVGHFGLNLRRYGHFTSPIRRYADLLVHRALVGALGLGAGGLPEGAEESFDRIGEHISTTERRAAAAERDALDRYMAAYMAERVGAVFSGRISGVTRFGLFVALDETGADGIVPRRSIATNVDHDEDGQRLVTPDRIFTLGDAVEVRLSEANVATGSLVFELVSGGAEAPRRGGAKRKLAREKKTARRSGKRESRRR
ncbi:MAG: ribonuclease R [Proteobacteria bacterium]|nr:ribonuclease R [Pseudomonadota bacterium]